MKNVCLFWKCFVALLTLTTPIINVAYEKVILCFGFISLYTLFTFASLVGDRTIPVEVAQLSDSLKRMYAPDKRVALFDVDYSFAGKT